MNEFVGIPYAKMDCYALVREVSEKVYGTKLPEVRHYADNPEAAIERWSRCLNWKEVAAPVEGCVVVMGQSIGCARHVGIYIGDGIMHSTRKYGSVVQSVRQAVMAGYTHLRYYVWEKNV